MILGEKYDIHFEYENGVESKNLFWDIGAGAKKFITKVENSFIIDWSLGNNSDFTLNFIDDENLYSITATAKYPVSATFSWDSYNFTYTAEFRDEDNKLMTSSQALKFVDNFSVDFGGIHKEGKVTTYDLIREPILDPTTIITGSVSLKYTASTGKTYTYNFSDAS